MIIQGLIWVSIFLNNVIISNPEQLAVSYFVENLLNEHYGSESKMLFSCESEDETEFSGSLCECLTADNCNSFVTNYRLHYKNEKIDKIPLIANSPVIKYSKKLSRRNLNLKVYRAIDYKDSLYVYLNVYKFEDFVDHYLIHISKVDGRITSCKTNEII